MPLSNSTSEQTRPLNREKVKSVNHALQLLNEAAEESSEEVKRMITKDFKQLKSIISEAKPAVRQSFNEFTEATAESMRNAKDKVVESSKHATQAVNRAAHDHPWYFVGGIAALSALLTYSLLRKSKG